MERVTASHCPHVQRQGSSHCDGDGPWAAQALSLFFFFFLFFSSLFCLLFLRFNATQKAKMSRRLRQVRLNSQPKLLFLSKKKRMEWDEKEKKKST